LLLLQPTAVAPTAIAAAARPAVAIMGTFMQVLQSW
jgi:hypothetical protein